MIDASTAGEDCSHWIGIPVDKRLVTCWVDIPHYFLHDVPVIDRNIIEIFWNVGKWIDANSILPVSIGEIGNILKISVFLDPLEELEEGFFRGIPPEDKIDERILTDDLLMIISGREPSQDDRDIGVHSFDEFSHGQ